VDADLSLEVTAPSLGGYLSNDRRSNVKYL